MRVLVACEFSGIVREAFRKRGHDAWSCDLLPTEDDSKYHIRENVLNILGDGWDMMIAFPPCTHLAIAGTAWFEKKRKDGRQQKAIQFFYEFVYAPINKICIENPIGIMNTIYRKPNQIIHPYYFGDEFSKSTCLWFKNLPLLKHFKQNDLFDKKTHVSKGEFIETSTGRRGAKWNYWLPENEKRWKIRSRTFQGIADAMAEQWG